MNVIKRLIYNLAKSLGYHVGIRPPAADSLRSHLAVMIDSFDINCVLDVGAYRGEFGRMVRDIGYSGRIVSWEPVLENFKILQKESESDPDWLVQNYALGQFEGQYKINLTNQTSLPSFLKPSEYGKDQFGHQLEVIGTQEVEVKRLETVFDECLTGITTPKVFLKLDTQGCDMQVIEGGLHCIDRVISIQSEVSVQPIYEEMPTYFDFIAKLNNLGFDLSGLFPVTIDRRMRLVEMDCVMIKRENDKPL